MDERERESLWGEGVGSPLSQLGNHVAEVKKYDCRGLEQCQVRNGKSFLIHSCVLLKKYVETKGEYR